MLEAIMGVEGGEGWHFNQNPQVESINADNFEAAARALKAKFDDKLWDAEGLKPEEIPRVQYQLA